MGVHGLELSLEKVAVILLNFLSIFRGLSLKTVVSAVVSALARLLSLLARSV